MLSEKKCKEILDKNNQGKIYSIEEVKKIREKLYIFSKIDLEKLKNKREK